MKTAPTVSLLHGIALSVLLVGQLGSAVAAECVKTVRWFDDAPYSYKAPDGSVQGLNPDLAREALARMNCQAKFVEMPWARALAELEAGRLDILPGALRRPERERFAYFSRPVNRSPNVLFVRKASADKFAISRLSDIVGTPFRLGMQPSVSYGPDYDVLAKTPAFAARLTTLTSRRSAWKMMELDRLDGIIADEVTGLVELEQLGLTREVIKTRIIVSSDAAMFALSKASVSKEFVDAFDKSLGSMLADGKYKQLRERHVPCTTSIETLGCK